MEMHQVRYFVALCEELNFTRAARRCGVAQPSLTNAIKRLEAELGAKLFQRHQRGAKLSCFGRTVRQLFYRIERSASEIGQAAKYECRLNRIKIATTTGPNRLVRKRNVRSNRPTNGTLLGRHRPLRADARLDPH
jgi:DNA-binding transcriptional LysR family regulator